MKRIIAFTLTLLLVFALVACGGDENDGNESLSVSDTSKQEESKTESTDTNEDSSVNAEDSSVAADESSVADEESSEAEVSGEESQPDESQPDESQPEESQPDEETAPDFIASFVSFGKVDTKVSATSQNALRLTGIDVEPTFGSIVLYTPEYGKLEKEEVSDFAVAIFTYNHDVFEYLLTDFSEAGAAGSFNAPEDGFAVVIHKSQNEYINRVKALDNNTPIFPHGIHLYTGADYEIDKVKTAPTIDGVFNKSEWKDYLIEKVDSSNHNWSYAQFETNNYYATASYYVAYDDTYLYLCVVVDSPYHYCPITSANAGDMWQYECIQAKISSESPAGDYIFENFDRVTNKTAENDGVIRNFGFAATDSGETAYYQSGTEYETFEGQVVCTRDDANAVTVYEVAIPFASIGVTPEKGAEIGFTFSINPTNEVDNVWKNITYRNGGGIIGRNDWTKIPVVTLD